VGLKGRVKRKGIKAGASEKGQGISSPPSGLILCLQEEVDPGIKLFIPYHLPIFRWFYMVEELEREYIALKDKVHDLREYL
jgi:hypothetical protein